MIFSIDKHTHTRYTEQIGKLLNSYLFSGNSLNYNDILGTEHNNNNDGIFKRIINNNKPMFIKNDVTRLNFSFYTKQKTSCWICCCL